MSTFHILNSLDIGLAVSSGENQIRSNEESKCSVTDGATIQTRIGSTMAV